MLSCVNWEQPVDWQALIAIRSTVRRAFVGEAHEGGEACFAPDSGLPPTAIMFMAREIRPEVRRDEYASALGWLVLLSGWGRLWATRLWRAGVIEIDVEGASGTRAVNVAHQVCIAFVRSHSWCICGL